MNSNAYFIVGTIQNYMGNAKNYYFLSKNVVFQFLCFTNFNWQKKSEKYFKWNIWNSGNYIIILDISNKMYQPLIVNGDQKLTNEMSIHWAIAISSYFYRVCV